MKTYKLFSISIIYLVLALILSNYKCLKDFIKRGNYTKKDLQSVNYTEDELKNSDWFRQIGKDIEKQEYHITDSENYKAYQSPNRKQNLRFIYHTDGFKAKPRQTKIPLFNITDMTIKEEDKQYREISDWIIRFKLTGYGRKLNERASYGEELKVDGKKASIEDEGLIIT